MRKRIVLGVDPGIANTGLAVVRGKVNGFDLLGSELVRSDAKMPKAERLLRIHEAVCRLIDLYQVWAGCY
ncbi:MAG: crossover junction endodeoxyribonuclease RuvC [Candidatus Poribacteria bacterium]|nr:crossover junction endodeoxyribonuclease RuvC [Candidatus Poribacteria bacterium]